MAGERGPEGGNTWAGREEGSPAGSPQGEGSRPEEGGLRSSLAAGTTWLAEMLDVLDGKVSGRGASRFRIVCGRRRLREMSTRGEMKVQR